MKVNWDEVPESGGFEPLPPGTYRGEIKNVDERTTRAGDPMWHLDIKVLQGEHRGRHVFDNLFFSKSGLRRVKNVGKQLGLPVEGTSELRPSDLVGLRVRVIVELEEYEGRQRNAVTYNGYQLADESEAPHQGKQSDSGASDAEVVPF